MGLTKNILYSSISTFSMVFLFLLLIFVGRYLGVDEYGIFTTALSFGMIAEIIADFGLRDFALRNISRDLDKTNLYVGNFVTWKLVISIFVFFLLWAVIAIMDYQVDVRLVILLMVVSSLAKSFKYTFRLFLQAHERFDLDALIENIEKITLFVVGCILLFVWRDLYVFIVGFCAIRLLSLLLMLYFIHIKISRISFRFNLGFSLNLQYKAIPFGLFAVIFILLSYLDSIMLSRMRGYEEVGLYNAAFRIFEGLTMLPTIIYLVILPKLSKLSVEDHTQHRKLSRQFSKYIILAAMPLIVLMFLFADQLIQFFGTDFSSASLTLKILSVGILFSYPTWIFTSILISTDLQKITLYGVIMGLVLNIVSNIFLIPIYGHYGAAAATVLSEILMFIYFFGYIQIRKFSLKLIRPIGIATFCLALPFVWFFILNDPSLWIKIAGALAALLVYFVLLIVFHVFDKDEYNCFRTLPLLKIVLPKVS